jgi:hypothetical protein
MTRRHTREYDSKMAVRLPERTLNESILHLAAPLLEPLGSAPSPEDVRNVLEIAVNLWNAHVRASLFWGRPNPKPLVAVRKAMCGKQAVSGSTDTFELLSARWRKEFTFDPRLVAEWSFDATNDGRHQLVCVTTLPDGVEAYVPPPAEKRIAIGAKFLDEVSIRQSATSSLSFPIEHHRGNVGDDGVVTIHTKLPTAVQLFAEGRLPPIGGVPVDVVVGGKKLGSMVLSEVSCTGYGGYNDVAVLKFRGETP